MPPSIQPKPQQFTQFPQEIHRYQEVASHAGSSADVKQKVAMMLRMGFSATEIEDSLGVGSLGGHHTY